jgi:hypothetical protein
MVFQIAYSHLYHILLILLHTIITLLRWFPVLPSIPICFALIYTKGLQIFPSFDYSFRLVKVMKYTHVYLINFAFWIIFWNLL